MVKEDPKDDTNDQKTLEIALEEDTDEEEPEMIPENEEIEDDDMMANNEDDNVVDMDDEDDKDMMEDDFDIYLEWVPPKEIINQEDSSQHESIDEGDYWNKTHRIHKIWASTCKTYFQI